MYLATKWDTFNNTDDNSFDKDITDTDSKKTMQDHFKLKKSVHRKCMTYLWRIWGEETSDVMINMSEAKYYVKAGSLCISWIT